MSDSKSTEEMQHAIDTLVSVSLDLGKQAKMMTLADVHTPQAIPDNVKLDIALKPYKDRVLQLFDQELDKAEKGYQVSLAMMKEYYEKESLRRVEEAVSDALDWVHDNPGEYDKQLFKKELREGYRASRRALEIATDGGSLPRFYPDTFTTQTKEEK